MSVLDVTTHYLILGISSKSPDYHAVAVDVTPEMAHEWLTVNNVGNRTPSPSRIVDYATQMIVPGAWRQDGNTIAFDTNGRLINGAHRCHGIVQSGCTVRMLVALNCDPLGFGTTDTGLNRNAKNILSIIDPGGKYHSEMGSLARFVTLYEADALGRKYVVHNEDITNRFAEQGETLRYCCEQAGAAYNHVRGGKLPLSSAFWLLNRVDPAAALEFYTTWPQGLGFTEGDPRGALTRVWRNAPQRTNSLDRTAWVIKGYNCWVRGEARTVIAWRRQETFPVPISRLAFGLELEKRATAREILLEAEGEDT